MHVTTRSLNDGWSFRELHPAPMPFTDVSRWLPAQVPGHVHLDLMRLGLIPDPFERMYERSVQWVDETDWAYRKTFNISEAELDGARLLLRFDGLDTIARILLNGAQIGETENMFVAHEFDVTTLLQAGENTLEVQFASAQRVGEQRCADWLAADAERAVFERGLMGRSFVRKAQYMYGWDWGPCLRGCGIWQGVELLRIPTARIRDWAYDATFGAGNHCRVRVRVQVEGHANELIVTLGRSDQQIMGQAAVIDGTAEMMLILPDVQRWWPAGLGDQPLYDLALTLENHGRTADTLMARIGLRELELVREPDAAGESFFFRVNGAPLFCKGANWIPADSFPARVSAQRYRDHLLLARECGMNMLRIWGGGIFETEAFYTACDELGLLVWQDFPYACALYPDDEAACTAAFAESAAAVRRLRNHPSLALYCGNNENQMLGWYGLWGQLPRILGDKLYDEVIPRAVSQEDPTRPYWAGSPVGSPPPGTAENDPWTQFISPGGAALGPNPNSEAAGDCHYWNVWHGAGDWRYYTDCKARFVSEFGFASPPDMLTFNESLLPGDQGVDTPAMRWHDKTNKGYETYLGFIALHYPMPTTLPDLIYYGQLNQAEGMKYGIEHFRRLRPHTMGTLVWQLNDCWPVQSWAWLDHRMRPKAAWYYAKRFYAPLLVSMAHDGDHLSVHLINDEPTPVEGSLTIRAIDAQGAILWEVGSPARAEAASSTQVFAAQLPEAVLAAADHAILYATFGGADNTILLAEPKAMRLAPARPTISTTSGADGMSLEVRISAPELILSMMLWLDGMDATWSDNFFHLLPGTPRTVTVRPATHIPPAEIAARLRWRSL